MGAVSDGLVGFAKCIFECDFDCRNVRVYHGGPGACTRFEMNDTTWQRLFGFRHAFDHPVTVVVALTAVVLLVLAPILIFITTRAAKSTAEKRKELWDRYRSWIWLVLCILIPILAGAFWTILAVAILSLLCYREYARITGLFRERTISFIVVIGILLITFAELDNW